MDNNFVSAAEHKEFVKRIEQENHRQNERLRLLEENVRQIGSLTTSVEKLASNMESMVKEQERQGEKIERMESAPAKKWDTLTTVIITALASGIITFILTNIFS